MNIKLSILIMSLLSVTSATAQNLEAQGGLDEKSVSTAMKDGISSSRVIILSDLSLSFTTNMGDIPSEDIKSGLTNGMNVDTLYFYLNPFDSHRRLIITADGFTPIRIDLKLPPKATYLYTILEPENASDEFLQREKQYELGCNQFDSKSWVSAINTLAPLAANGHIESQDKLCFIFRDIRIRETMPSDIYSKFITEYENNQPYAQFIWCTQYFDKYGLLTEKEEELFKILEHAALSGNSYAQSSVGSAYQAGIGVKLDSFKAIEWYERAASLDNPSAMLNLAIMVGNGTGIKADKVKSLELTKQGVELGDEFAMELLGQKYAFGAGIKNDSEKAIYWFKKAGDAGVNRAWGMIGVMYLYGTIVKQDYKKAYEFFNKGAELNDSYSMTFIGSMYINGYGVKADHNKGINWLIRSAELGDCSGQCSLAGHYLNDHNYNEAWKWYRISGENRNTIGYYRMGEMCENNQAPSPYKQKHCIEWYEKAASTGSKDAIERLIEIYSKGIYVKKSRADEMKWRVALANIWCDTKTMVNVANAYLNGDGLEMNEIEAIKYLELAASFNSKEAMLTLSKLYREGIGVFADEKLADEWLEKANKTN